MWQNIGYKRAAEMELLMSRYIFLDIESTGLSTKNGHRIIELAMLEIEDRQLTINTCHYYFNPKRPIEPTATAIHGITDSQLADKPEFNYHVDSIVSLITDATIIAHNAKFDIEFLDMELQNAGYLPTSSYVSGIIDTLDIARKLYPKQKNSLDALCDRLEVDRSNRQFHGALIDCELLYKVYLKLVPEASEADKITIEQFNNIIELPIIYASDADNLAHSKYMESINEKT